MDLLWPGSLLLIGLIPLLIAAYLVVLRRRRRFAVRYSSLSLVREALPQHSRWRRHIPFALFLVALFSLMPWFFGFRPLWYQLWLAVVLAAMVWVTVRRLSRTRQAAEEAKRKRDEAGRSGRPPWVK